MEGINVTIFVYLASISSKFFDLGGDHGCRILVNACKLKIFSYKNIVSQPTVFADFYIGKKKTT
jgi:hypothetical protein